MPLSWSWCTSLSWTRTGRGFSTRRRSTSCHSTCRSRCPATSCTALRRSRSGTPSLTLLWPLGSDHTLRAEAVDLFTLSLNPCGHRTNCVGKCHCRLPRWRTSGSIYFVFAQYRIVSPYHCNTGIEVDCSDNTAVFAHCFPHTLLNMFLDGIPFCDFRPLEAIASNRLT